MDFVCCGLCGCFCFHFYLFLFFCTCWYFLTCVCMQSFDAVIFDLSSCVIHQEFKYAAGLEMAQGPFVCLVSECLCLLPFDCCVHISVPVFSPQSVNSASLLVEQSSHRSLQQNSSVSQICSFNTKQCGLCNLAPARVCCASTTNWCIAFDFSDSCLHLFMW